MDRATYATQALLWSLRRDLPAALTAADVTRRAKVVCPPGPYTIPAAGTLIINGTTIALTAGSRTATQVAAEINASIPALASVDASLGLVLTGAAAPTATAPSTITVYDGTANEALGLQAGDSDRIVQAIGTPRVRFFERQLALLDDWDGPVVAFEREVRDTSQVPLRLDAAIINIALLAVVPGFPDCAAAAHEAVSAFAQALAGVIRTGDGRASSNAENLIGGETYGSLIEKAEVGPVAVSYAERGNKTTHIPYGVAQIPIEVRLYDA